MGSLDYFPAEKHMRVPSVDILTWTFGKFEEIDQDKPVSHNVVKISLNFYQTCSEYLRRLTKAWQIYIDAQNPSRSYSARQTQVLVRLLISGLQNAGLGKGDCVCLCALNDVGYLYFFL